jgi:ABC-type dipeptide/oligopeptide/nickel transport system, ATPase component
MSILTVKDLYKSYGEGDARQTVVDGVSFSVEPGQCFGLLGT